MISVFRGKRGKLGAKFFEFCPFKKWLIYADIKHFGAKGARF